MATPVLSGFTHAMVKVEPGLKIKEENFEDLNIEMCETAKVKVEPGFEVKTDEEFENIDDKVPDAMLEIKDEPGDDVKVEKIEKINEWSIHRLKTEKCDEVDAESEISESKDFGKNVAVIKSWIRCVPFQTVVEGTSFVPFKMPFSGSEVQPCSNEKSFHISDLIQAFPNIGLIIDLSNDRRTYCVSDLIAYDVQYVNIPIQFHHHLSVPNVQQLNQFIQTCSNYSTSYPDKLIGVHDDQLGDRAAAYVICKVLEQTGLSMELAMKRFKDGRGYRIYTSLAGVLNGSRRPWILDSTFTPKRRFSTKKSNKQLKAQQRAIKERKANKQTKSEGKKLKAQRVMEQQNT